MGYLILSPLCFSYSTFLLCIHQEIPFLVISFGEKIMFKKKCTIKEAQSLGKSNLKSLRVDVLDVIGNDNSDIFDLIVGGKHTVTKSKYQCGAEASAFVYSINNVPFFISVYRLSEKERALVTDDRCRSYAMIPTLFFFLRLHQLYGDKSERWSRLVDKAGVAVTCLGSTSHFLLSGSHLMIPGIVKVHSTASVTVGQLALVFTAGVNVPYAVGFVTSNLVAQKDSGVGVYVVQCFRDNLWEEHENHFLANYSLSSNALLIPAQFGENEVALENKGTSHEEAPVDLQDDNESAIDSPDNNANEGVRSKYAALFQDEDAVLKFCMCEAVKEISRSSLPLPLQQFTSAVVQLFPRDGAHTEHIHFKDTRYKRALPFFQRFPELLTISETSPGVYSVSSVNKSAPVMLEHMTKYKTFLETDHREACEKEARDLQAKFLEDGVAVFRQRVVSSGVFYTAPRDLDERLVRILMLGEELNVPESVRFPTLEQVMGGTVPKYEPTPIDGKVFDELYTRKELVDNLKKYIVSHSLLIVNASGKGQLPNVKINETLSILLSSKEYASELPLNKVQDAMLRLFKINHEVVLQTVIEGSSLASEHLIPKRILKPGNLPKVNLWSIKLRNRDVTIVRNLESFGFDLDLLARRWKKQFSLSCRVVDPAAEMKGLKTGTKIPLEVHLQGNLVSKVEAALLNEANLPQSVLVLGKI
ncbi:hypothetical protein ABL78_3136 [Leptomonas seymouri]|uniref:SUI1 domain-containing protein n=1 Tax=Leptomonas seymouri TaxID=5684 RepID=A0A0N1I577_LEPSE|nr:hypothetical protein ABL78_3136 [Leptomonas seymouri]|eukprot:KPI87778.1 hypothetical protein ABL78_3136 [Leptomonas seymouri]